MCRLHAGLSANETVRTSKKAWGHEEGRWVRCFQRAWQRERGERGRGRDPWYTSTNRRTHKKRTEKKKLVTFLRHLKTCWLFWDACCLLMSGECLSHFPSDHVLMVTVHDKQLNAPLPLSWRAALYIEIWHHKAHRLKAELSRFGPERRSSLVSFFNSIRFSSSLFFILFFENPNALCTLLLPSAFGYSLAVHDSFTYINETPRWEAGVIGPIISVHN